MTKRQELITQLRQALGQLTSPSDECVTFEVGDVEFNFEQHELDTQSFQQYY